MLTTAVIVICLNLSPIHSPIHGEKGMGQWAIAHEVETDKEVGATLHVEPSDTPRAGEESLAWFALTRRGGKTIPLAACDCQMAVYSQPRGAEPILRPPLTPTSAEGYQDLPGATFTFPKVGAYTLVLSGKPAAQAGEIESFEPLELDFDVTVAAGNSVPTAPADSTAPLPDAANPAESPREPAPGRFSSGIAPKGIAVVVAVVIVVGLLRLLVWRSRHKS